ncbi:MAG TPA: glutathionylspermidine synthase family protein [Burkholderiales bacterium]|nr:glutathionylspermidine synthase family protein [Burkholderiales bacterium]
MERMRMTPRTDWRRQFEELGFGFHSLDDLYWDESACYRFSAAEIDMLEAVTAELYELSLKAAEHIMEKRQFERFAIPDWFADYMVNSWLAGQASLYGRFDLCYDGVHPPKLLEFNADTPTSLIEAAIAQWNWQQQVFPACDQFNSLHEKLIARWTEIRNGLGGPLHFACVKNSEEDLGNVEYLRDTALQAGIDARHIFVEDIGWSGRDRSFVDEDGHPIRALFKLYPWEWMMREEFGPRLPEATLVVIEPPWKLLLSCKAILAVLWELYPGHPNLLPCYFDERRLPERFVRKPLYSREGANVEIHGPRGVYARQGSYGAEGYICQGYAPLPGFDGNYAVIGSWIIGNEPGGIGIREDKNPITNNLSRFVPHYFD